MNDLLKWKNEIMTCHEKKTHKKAFKNLKIPPVHKTKSHPFEGEKKNFLARKKS